MWLPMQSDRKAALQKMDRERRGSGAALTRGGSLSTSNTMQRMNSGIQSGRLPSAVKRIPIDAHKLGTGIANGEFPSISPRSTLLQAGILATDRFARMFEDLFVSKLMLNHYRRIMR